jgi:hypothetical protein
MPHSGGGLNKVGIPTHNQIGASEEALAQSTIAALYAQCSKMSQNWNDMKNCFIRGYKFRMPILEPVFQAQCDNTPVISSSHWLC